MPASPTLPPPSRTVDDLAEPTTYLRLLSCPRCAGRSRAISETGSALVGRCLSCGEELALPLATERQGHLTIVGRAGQGILQIETGD